MRILTKKLWRAFPELDAFDDALCRKFVRAVTVRWRAQILRWGVVSIVVVIGFVGTILAMAASDNASATAGRMRTWSDGLVVAFQTAILSFGFLFGFVLAMIVRDQILRRQVRRVIRKRGACGKCSYSLIGMPVGADLRVICPECGTITVVDRALGELAPVAGSESLVFNPVAPTIDEGRSKRRWAFIRRVVKWASLSLLLLVLLLGGMLAFVWTRLAADRTKAWQVLPHRAGAEILYDEARKDARARWGKDGPSDKDVMALLDSFIEEEAKARGENMAGFTPAQYLQSGSNIEYWLVYLNPLEKARNRPSNSPAQVQYEQQELKRVRRVVREVRETEAGRNLSRLHEMLPWSLRLMPRWSDGFTQSYFAESQSLYRARDFSLALAAIARRENDKAGFLQGMEQALAASQMVIESARLAPAVPGVRARVVVAEQAQQLVLDPAKKDWLADTQALLVKYLQTPRLDRAVRGEACGIREAIAGAYSEPTYIFKSRYVPQPGGPSAPSRDDTFDRSLDENLSIVNAFEEYYAAIAAREPFERAGISMPTVPAGGIGGMGLMLNMRWTMSVVAMHDAAVLQMRAAIVLLGIHRFHARTGSWPDALSRLTIDDLGVAPERVLDPYSGKAFGYIRLQPGADAENRAYLLYSAGIDLTDDGGKLAADPRTMPQGITPTTGSDYILNPVPEPPESPDAGEKSMNTPSKKQP